MTYPQWWERLVAGIVDGIILAIVGWILRTILLSIVGFNYTGIIIMLILWTILYVAIIVGYKVFFEAGQWQATPGKMIFGIKVVDASGGKAPSKQVLIRTWPWWLNLVSILTIFSLTLATTLSLLIFVAMIVIFCSFFMDPKGRCLHDQTAKLNVIKAGKGVVA